MDGINDYLFRNRERFLDGLCEFLRIPSVSGVEANRADMQQAAEWLAEAMRAAGLTSEVHFGEGPPIVLGEWRGAGEQAPTVLIYGHYDVQPAGPSNLWHTPPFEPTIRDDRIYARGATDDKGQLLLHVNAIAAWLAVHGELPVNVLVLAEGEEEIGGTSLSAFIETHRERLQCTAVVISDSAMIAPGLPAVVTTLRGFAGYEIEVFGPATELHSGEYGGAVVNPATVLAGILASAHDDDGSVAIPGFTDRCRDWPESQRDALSRLPFTDEAFRLEAGVAELGGERGYTTLERRWMRPTFEVNGFIGGYTGPGMSSVIPSSALAKVSCRLVPDQDPEEIDQLIVQWVDEKTPPGVRAEVRRLSSTPPWRTGNGDWLHQAATQAVQAVFRHPPALVGGGGSIPVVTDIERVLGAPVLLLGFGLPGENAHAPNEHFSLANFDLGMRTSAALWEQIGKSLEPENVR